MSNIRAGTGRLASLPATDLLRLAAPAINTAPVIGNRTGWIIAAAIVAIECAGVFYALSFDAHTPPTPLTNPESLSPITLPTAPIAHTPTSGTASATVLYRAAIAEYLAHAGEYEEAMRNRSRSALLKLPALDKIIAARSARGDAIFADHLDEIIAYGEPNSLQAITRLGNAVYIVGTLYSRPADRAKGQEYYQATFALGRRLANEKITWREYQSGVELMADSGAAMLVELKKSPDNASAAASLQAYLDAIAAQRKQTITTIEALNTRAEAKIALHAGDVFAFAVESQETMMRVEAILKLGRMRYNVGTPPLPGNQRHASRLLRKFKESDEPAIRRAAELAQSLTIEEFRTLR